MLKHKGTRPLNTERLVLRRILPQDAEMVYAWMGDPEVCRYERWEPHPHPDYSRGFIVEVFGDYRSDRLYWWGIELEGILIGSICANVDDLDEKATLGYCLAREYWSRGYMTEAIKAVLSYLFCQVGLNRVEAYHSVNNPASGRVLQKAGFVLEGHAKEYYRCACGFQDSDLYGLPRSIYLQSDSGL